MGSVFRREKERRYSIAWVDETGKRRTKRSSKDRRVALAELAQLEDRAERIRLGMPVADAMPSRAFADALDDYGAELLSLGCTPVYIRRVSGTIENLAAACKWSQVSDIAADPFARCLAGLVENGLALSSRNAYHGRVFAFTEFCIDRGWLIANPLARLDKAREPADPADRPRAKRPFTVAEFESLTTRATIRPRRRQLYRVAGLSGLRCGELEQLQRQDFTLGANPTWHLRPRVTKAKRRDEVPMLPECADALAPLCFGKGPTDRIFRNRAHQDTMQVDLGRCNIPLRDHAGRVVSFHSFRYFFCWLIGRTLPIQLVRALMRHASIKTTMDLYLQIGLTDVAEAVKTLPPLLPTATSASATG